MNISLSSGGKLPCFFGVDTKVLNTTISKMSTRFVCGEVYGKVLIMRCDDRRLVGPQKNALGKREKAKKGKCNNVVCRSYGRSPMWYRTDGAMGIGYSWWRSCEGQKWSRRHGRCRRTCGVWKTIESQNRRP